jgi:hypothetical protein
VKRLAVALIIVLASCGSGESGQDAGDGAESAGSAAAPTTTSPAVSAPTTTAAPAATAEPATPSGPLDCAAQESILALLWNENATGASDSAAFTAFADEAPTGELRITAFDPVSRLVAGIWSFPDPQGDGLAQGIVWLDGEVVGDVYYLDGVDPLKTGEVDLLETEEFITLELGMATSGEAIAKGCWVGPKPPLIAYDTPLTIYGLGEIEPGMSLAEVLDAVGDFPHDLSDQLDWADGWCYVLAVEDTGVSLQLDGLGPDASPLDATVGAVVVSWGYSTPSGIATGATQAEVEAALGDQLEISPHAYVEGFYLDFVPNDPAEKHLRLRFVITSGVVTEMRAGLAKVTSLVEGCS